MMCRTTSTGRTIMRSKCLEKNVAAKGRGNGNVEEQERKQKKNFSTEQVAKVWESMKGKPLPADFDELDTPLRADIIEQLNELHRQALRRK